MIQTAPTGARETRAIPCADDWRLVRAVAIAAPFSLAVWALVLFVVYLALV